MQLLWIQSSDNWWRQQPRARKLFSLSSLHLIKEIWLININYVITFPPWADWKIRDFFVEHFALCSHWNWRAGTYHFDQIRSVLEDWNHTIDNNVIFEVLSVESLISEIGGSLGLFLGFSFLTLWDAVEFLGGLIGKLSLNLFKWKFSF